MSTHPSDNTHIPSQLKALFDSHPLNSDQASRVENLRHFALLFAIAINENCQYCKDKEAALRHVREALFTANACVALEEASATL